MELVHVPPALLSLLSSENHKVIHLWGGRGLRRLAIGGSV